MREQNLLSERVRAHAATLFGTLVQFCTASGLKIPAISRTAPITVDYDPYRILGDALYNCGQATRRTQSRSATGALSPRAPSTWIAVTNLELTYPGFGQGSINKVDWRSVHQDMTADDRQCSSSSAVRRSCEVSGPEYHAIAGRNVDKIEVHSGARDLAGQVSQDAGAVLRVDHHHLALAGDREMRNRQRMPRGLGVGDEDVKLGSLARSDAGRRGDVHARIADRGRYLGQRSRGVLDFDDEVECHLYRAAAAC